MRRIIAAAALGLVTFSGVYGFAASLNLTTDGLGSATEVVAGCQSATLTASYTPAYSASVPGYTVGTVTVSGLASTCYGKAYRLTLAGSGGTTLGEATGTTPSTGSSFNATLSPAVNAMSVIGVSLVISG